MKKKTKSIIRLSFLIVAFILYAVFFTGLGGFNNGDDDSLEFVDTDLFYLDSYDDANNNGFTDIAVLEDTMVALNPNWEYAKLLNISDPTNIYEIMDLKDSFETYLYSPIISDKNTLYMAGNYGLERYDCSDPTNFKFTGVLADMDGAESMELSDGLLYYINSPITNTFTVINTTADVSTGNTGVISNWTAPSNYIRFEKMQIFDDIAILAYSDGIMIVNISNPHNIEYLAEYETELPRAMVKYGEILYLSDEYGLKCLNISDYSEIALIKEYTSNYYVFEDLELQGGYAYGFRKYDSEFQKMNILETLICLDIRDPLNVEVIAENKDLKCLSIDIQDDLLYVSGFYREDGKEYPPDTYYQYGIMIVKLFETLNLSDSSVAEVKKFESLSKVEDVVAYGDHVYVANGDDGISIIDYSNTSHLEQIGAIDTTGSAMDIAIRGSTIFVADDDNGFMILDASNPANLEIIDSYDVGGNSNSLDLQRAYTCVAEGSAGISLLNTSDYYNIEELSVFDTLGTAMDVDVNDHIAYVADLDGGLLCINITDTTAPSQIGNIDLGSDAINVFYADSIAYVATKDAGLKIVNVRDPTNPSLITTYTTVGEVNDVTVSGDTAYLNVKGYGYEAINISVPNSPISIGYTASAGGQNGSCIYAGYAFVADGASGLSIIKAVHTGVDDFDNDDLNYLEETWNWGTDLFNNDTDNDGLSDGYESSFYYGWLLGGEEGINLPLLQPLVADADADADYDDLTNLEEYRMGLNPLKSDTDGDKVYDGGEIFDGTDPLDPTSYIEQTDPGLIIFGVIVFVAVILTILRSMGVFAKRAPLNVFLSHAVIDFEKRHIKDMSEFLGGKEFVNRGFYCEQDMKGNIDDWMDEMVPLSHIFVFIASKKSVHNSVDCGREIRLGNQYGLFMIPIRTEEVTWDAIENIGLPGKEKGLEYPTNAKGIPKELFKQLDEKIMTIYENMKKLNKSLEDNDFADMATFDETLELDTGDAARLARILIKNGDVKGALSVDANQYISADEISRQAKVLFKQSEDKSINMIMDNLGIDPFYEHEVYDYLKKYLDPSKSKGKKVRNKDEITPETIKKPESDNSDEN